MQSVTAEGLFPVGEGAGYAGGIVSARWVVGGAGGARRGEFLRHDVGGGGGVELFVNRRTRKIGRIVVENSRYITEVSTPSLYSACLSQSGEGFRFRALVVNLLVSGTTHTSTRSCYKFVRFYCCVMSQRCDIV